MVDIHNHILFSVDDGAKTKEDSLNILKNMKKLGYTDVVFTPHYFTAANYIANNSKKEEIFNVLKNEIKEQNLDMSIYLGNEIYIDTKIGTKIKENEIMSINKNKYILVEFPFSEYDRRIDFFLSDIFGLGFIPVIAHVERYSFVQENPNVLLDYIDRGVVIQSNIASLSLKYGKKAKKCLETLLKNNLVNVLSTDIHNINMIESNQLQKGLKKAKQILKKEQFDTLTRVNPLNIIKGEDIFTYESKYIKKKTIF